MPSRTVWIITHRHGDAYPDWYSTRISAIIDHVNALDDVCRTENNIYGPLTDNQRRAWAERKLRGDRAVKATLTWDESSGGGSDG